MSIMELIICVISSALFWNSFRSMFCNFIIFFFFFNLSLIFDCDVSITSREGVSYSLNNHVYTTFVFNYVNLQYQKICK